MTTEKLIILARKHLGGPMESSARLCLEDALYWHNKWEDANARRMAVRSLEYSIGICHPDYKRATR